MKNKNLHDELKSIPLAERPTMLAPPWAKEFFQGAALLQIVLPMLLLISNGIAATIIRRQGGPALATVIAVGFLFGAHGRVCSGVASSNTVTICRKTEPIRFWLSVIVLYLISALLGFISWAI